MPIAIVFADVSIPMLTSGRGSTSSPTPVLLVRDDGNGDDDEDEGETSTSVDSSSSSAPVGGEIDETDVAAVDVVVVAVADAVCSAALPELMFIF